MPQYVVTSPEGKKYRITAPEGATQDDVLAYAQSQYGQKSGFFDGVKQDLGARAEKYGNILNSQEPALGKAYLALGQSAGLANDVTGRAMSAITPDFIGEPLQKAGQYVLNSFGNLPSMGGGSIGETIPQELNSLAQEYPRASEYAKATGNLGLLAAATKIGSSKPVVDTASKATKVGKDAAIKAGDSMAEGGKGLLRTAIPAVDDQTAKLATYATDVRGIPLKLSQVADSQPLKILDAVSEKLPFQGSQKFTEKQLDAFHRELAKEIGETADDLGPATIKSFTQKASKKFESALDRETVNFNPKSVQQLDDMILSAEDSIDPGLASVVAKNVKKLQDVISVSPQVKGEQVASIRSELLKNLARSQGGAKEFLGDLVEYIDEAVEASLPEEKVKLLSKTRKEWRNYKTLLPLLEKSPDGRISPASLMTRVAASPYIKASSSEVGADGLVDLARIGQSFLKQQVPDSGTSQRFMYGSGLLGGGFALGVEPATVAAGIGVGRGLNSLNRNQSILRKAIQNDGLLRLKSPAPNGILSQ